MYFAPLRYDFYSGKRRADDVMRKAVISIAKKVFNASYRRHCAKPRRNLAAFLSRQTDTPSYDFAELARAFEAHGWETVMHLQKVTKRSLPRYFGHALREARLLAECKVAIIDRFDPVIALIDLECDLDEDARASGLHYEFPTQPIVLQAWHAFGSFKKFGFQSADTPEGHASDYLADFGVHRNCSWILCSGAGAREAFAQAFAYPIERVVALGRPEYDELTARRAMDQKAETSMDATADTAQARVLMAPTLRKSAESSHPFRSLYAEREQFESRVDARVDWAFHPLEQNLPAPGNVSDELLESDLVVTDYSSLVYEAYLLGKPVLFYVPDIEEYRVSPGLNMDPCVLAPSLCAYTPDELAQLIERTLAGDYPIDEFKHFIGDAFAQEDTITGTVGARNAAERIVDFAIAHSQN